MSSEDHASAMSMAPAERLGPSDCRIAVVPSMGLGDGCVYLVLASNLARAGYQVTLFSNHLAPIASWFPAFKTLSLPAPEKTLATLDSYDLAICDLGSMAGRLDIPLAETAKRVVFVGTCKVDPSVLANPASTALAKLPASKRVLLQDMAQAAGSLRCLDDDSVTMVDQAVHFCISKLGIENATKDIELAPPKSLQHRRFVNRIMIHPLSYNAKKNWPREKFVSLAQRLIAKGLAPEFVLSPKEQIAHGSAFSGGFPMPSFQDARALAEYLFESGYVIGNDSGIGHLASLLGIPVLTLYRKRRDGFCWRPGWCRGAVVRPALSLGIARDAWPHLMSVGRVEKAFQTLKTTVEKGE